jgi:hypothetical protein
MKLIKIFITRGVTELTNEVVDLTKSSRRSDTKVCHAMDQRSTDEEVDQVDETRHRFHG